MLEALKEVLAQGESLILALDDSEFSRKILLASNATIGAHYRHTLEHFRSLLEGLNLEEIDYDARKRDILLETQRDAALCETREILRRLTLLEVDALDEPIMARFKISYDAEESAVSKSTVGREIMFCISHAIHHYALIAMMARTLQISLPSGFGVAPSTMKHQKVVAQNN